MTLLYDGKLIDEQTVPVSFRGGLWRGAGWFETLAVKEDEVYNIDTHLDRLRRTLPQDAGDDLRLDTIPEKLSELGSLSKSETARLKLVVWEETGNYRLAAWVKDYNPPTRENYTDGVNLQIQLRSHPPRWPLTDQKRTSYAPAMVQRDRTEAWDILYCDLDGKVWETTVANIFWLSDGTLHYPKPDGHLLVGTVMEAILESAGKLGLDLQGGSARWDELGEFCWVTNSLIGMMPVNQIAGTTYGNSEPPELWLELRETLLSDRVFPQWYNLD